MTTKERLGQTVHARLLESDEERSKTYLFHIDYKPRLMDDDADGGEPRMTYAEYSTPQNPARHVREKESPRHRHYVQFPYATVKFITHDSRGREIKSVMREVKAILAARKLVIRPDASAALPAERCPVATSLGWTNVPLHVLDHKVSDGKHNRGVTFYLGEQPCDMSRILQRREKKAASAAKLMKRKKREYSKAPLSIRLQKAADDVATTFPLILFGDTYLLNATLKTVEVVGLNHYGTAIDLRGVPLRFTYLNIHCEDSDICQYAHGFLDGRATVGIDQITRLFKTYHLNQVLPTPTLGVAGKITKSDSCGHDKGVYETNYLKHHLVVFFGTKDDVRQEDDLTWLSLDFNKPFSQLKCDYETFINIDAGSAKFRDTDLSFLIGCGREWLEDYRSMFYDLEGGTARLAKRLPQLLIDNPEYQPKWLLPAMVEELAKGHTDPDGIPYGVQGVPKVMASAVRYLRSMYKTKDLSFPIPRDQAATGYLTPDRSIVYHPDPELNGNCFNLDGAALEPFEAAMCWPQTVSVNGISYEMRLPLAGPAFLYRRPFSWAGEGVKDVRFVAKQGYASPDSASLYLSIKPVEITAEVHEFLSQVLTPDAHTALYGKGLQHNGKFYIAYLTIVYALMGGGDGDDIACALLRQLGAHATRHYDRLVALYPDSDISSAPDEEPDLSNRHADIEARYSRFIKGTRVPEIQAVEGLLTDRSIGINTILEFVVNSALNEALRRPGGLEALRAACPDLWNAGGIMRNKEKIIDKAKLGEGAIDLDLVTKYREAVYTGLAQSGVALPHYVWKRLGGKTAESIRYEITATDRDLEAFYADLESFFTTLEDTFVYPKPENVRDFDFLLAYPLPDDSTVASAREIRKEFSQFVSIRALELLRDTAHIHGNDPDHPRYAFYKEKASHQAAIEVDGWLYASIPQDRLTDLAIATYQISRMGEKKMRKGRTYLRRNEGQVFLPVLGTALVRGIRQAAGAPVPDPTPDTTPTTPTPESTPAPTPASAPVVGVPEPVAEPQTLRVTLINRANPNLLGPAGAHEMVVLRFLDEHNAEDMAFFHQQIPSYAAKGILRDAVVVSLGTQVYAWVCAEHLGHFVDLVAATGDTEWLGTLMPRKEGHKTAVDCLVTV